MLFSRDKEDDDDFVPNPNYHSNLASIFGSSGGGGERNSSLTYTPPKQPKRQNKPSTIATPSSSGSRSSSLLCAKTVQTFKMLDGEYQNQGKVGAAVLSFASNEGTSYQILLYRDKQNHLCNARITRDFNFHIQPKNYCTFYDKQNVIWSMLFDSPADMAEFNLQVAKCRWKSEQSTSPILIQELWCPVVNGEASKTSASVGDTVELTYTLSTIDSTSEVVEEAQRVVVEVESSGWKQALVGVQLNSQRVIILQPFMLGDLNPSEVVYNNPVVVKFTILQVSTPPPSEHLSKPKAVFHTVPAAEEVKHEMEPSPKPEPALPDISDEKTTESPRSPKSTKADLINRMARMGQALPFKKVVPAPSDSDETEEDRKAPVQRFGKVVPKPRSRVQHTTPSLATGEETGEGEIPSLNPPVPVIPQVPMQWPPGVQPYMVGNMYPVPQVNSPLDCQAQFNMFLSEIRTTNSELRMGLTRLTDKVENIQTKVEDVKKTQRPEDVNTILERLMEGEQQLKDQLQQVLTTLQTTQLSSQSRTSGEVVVQPQAEPVYAAPDTPSVTSCQQCAELRQVHTSLSEKIEKLQEENELLQVSLTAQKDALFNAKIADKDQLSQIESFQRQLCEEKTNVTELKISLESLQRAKENLAEDLQTANNSITGLQKTLQEKQMNIDRLEQTLRESEATKLEEVRRNLQEVLDPKPVIGEHIKKILNAVYRLVRVQFEPQGKYDANFIQSVLAETIKAVTLEYLQNGDLLSSGRATPAVSVQSVPDTSEQAKSEELRTLYMDREQRASTDTDCKSAVASSLVSVSSESSLISQKTSENKVTETSHAEEVLNGNQSGLPVDNKTSVETPYSVADTTDDSSDDGKSLVSVKLETVLLHLSQSQSKMADPLPSSSSWHPPLPQSQSKMTDHLPTSSPWHPPLPQSQPKMSDPLPTSSPWHPLLPQSHPFLQFLRE